jgi:hypothetical protein
VEHGFEDYRDTTSAFPVNAQEIERIIAIIQAMQPRLSAPPIPLSQICIICPFQAQTAAVRKELRKKGLVGVFCNTITVTL